MGWTQQCLEAFLNAQDRVPREIKDATKRKDDRASQGSLITYGYCEVPGIATHAVHEHHAP